MNRNEGQVTINDNGRRIVVGRLKRFDGYLVFLKRFASSALTLIEGVRHFGLDQEIFDSHLFDAVFAVEMADGKTKMAFAIPRNIFARTDVEPLPGRPRMIFACLDDPCIREIPDYPISEIKAVELLHEMFPV
jgi:hypothetical protein